MPHLSLPFLIAQCSDVTFVGSSQDFSSMQRVDDGAMPQSPSWVLYIESNPSNTSWGASATYSETNPRAGSVRSWSLLAPTPVPKRNYDWSHKRGHGVVNGHS